MLVSAPFVVYLDYFYIFIYATKKDCCLGFQCRGISKGDMFHSDRGSQFTSLDFRKELDKLNMVQSFFVKVHPYDNAVMECFFKYLKKEKLDRCTFQNVEQLKQNPLSYISGFYNPIRPHSHNYGLSPDQAENPLSV